MPCKCVIYSHSEFLENAGYFISKARSHTNYGTQALKLLCNFFNLRNINCTLLFDISFNFCAFTDCVTNSTKPGFKTSYSRMVDCAYIRNTVSFFKCVSKISSQSTADTNCTKSLTQVAKLFDSCVTVKELGFSIKYFVKDFCNLRACTFIEVFDIDCTTLGFRWLNNSLQNCVVRNIKTTGPDSGLKAFAVNRNYRNWKFCIQVACNTVYIFTSYTGNTACRNKDCVRLVSIISMLNDFSKIVCSTKYGVFFVQICTYKNRVSCLVYAGCNLSELYGIVTCHCSTTCRCMVNNSYITDSCKSIQSTT